MPLDDGSRPNKRSCYTPDPLPTDIYVSYEKYSINFNTPYEYPQVILLRFYTPSTYHTIAREKPGCTKE